MPRTRRWLRCGGLNVGEKLLKRVWVDGADSELLGGVCLGAGDGSVCDEQRGRARDASRYGETRFLCSLLERLSAVGGAACDSNSVSDPEALADCPAGGKRIEAPAQTVDSLIVRLAEQVGNGRFWEGQEPRDRLMRSSPATATATTRRPM